MGLKRKLFIVMFAVSLVTALAFLTRSPTVKIEDRDLSLERARSFLESQFVPEAGLLRAAVYAEPDRRRIYIASDNLLASRAFNALKSEMGRIIAEKLAAEHGNGFNGRHEVLFGADIPDEFYVHTNVKVGEIKSEKFEAVFEIMFEKPDTSRRLDDWDEYADLIVYRALDKAFRGEDASSLFRKLLRRWDGFGFRDKAFEAEKRYETYKVALALYLCQILKTRNEGCPADESVVGSWRNLLGLMQREDGGVVTHYVVENGKLKPVGDANVETTAIAFLALTTTS